MGASIGRARQRVLLRYHIPQVSRLLILSVVDIGIMDDYNVSMKQFRGMGASQSLDG